jgi:hypothetical protein
VQIIYYDGARGGPRMQIFVLQIVTVQGAPLQPHECPNPAGRRREDRNFSADEFQWTTAGAKSVIPCDLSFCCLH